MKLKILSAAVGIVAIFLIAFFFKLFFATATMFAFKIVGIVGLVVLLIAGLHFLSKIFDIN